MIDNYSELYFGIINNAKAENRKKGTCGVYYEKHHIMPDFMFKNRSRKGPAGHLLGNPNDPGNLVLLTFNKTKTVESMSKFTLPQKKVKVKPNFDNAGWIKNPRHAAFFKIEGAYESCPVAMSRSGQLKNPFTNEEKAALEEMLGYTSNELSVYNKNGILSEVYVRLSKDPLELDLADPMDYIKYKVLLTNSDRIAPSIKERNKKATYKFYVEDMDDVIEVQSKSANIQQTAWKEFGKMEDNKGRLAAFIKVYGQVMRIPATKIDKNTKLEFLQAKVSEIVQSKPKDFVDIVTSEDFDTMLLVAEGIDTGVIKKDGTRYFLESGDKLGDTLQATVSYLKLAASATSASIS